MTNKEAIERINGHIAIHRYSEPQAIHIAEALQMAIEALKKQMPMKPIKHEPIDLALFYRCPSCDTCLDDYIPRCIICGQAIDWKEIKIKESV